MLPGLVGFNVRHLTVPLRLPHRRLNGFNGTPLSARPMVPVARTGSSTPLALPTARGGSITPGKPPQRSTLPRNGSAAANPSELAASSGLAGSKRGRGDDLTSDPGTHAASLARRPRCTVPATTLVLVCSFPGARAAHATPAPPLRTSQRASSDGTNPGAAALPADAAGTPLLGSGYEAAGAGKRPRAVVAERRPWRPASSLLQPRLAAGAAGQRQLDPAGSAAAAAASPEAQGMTTTAARRILMALETMTSVSELPAPASCMHRPCAITVVRYYASFQCS